MVPIVTWFVWLDPGVPVYHRLKIVTLVHLQLVCNTCCPTCKCNCCLQRSGAASITHQLQVYESDNLRLCSLHINHTCIVLSINSYPVNTVIIWVSDTDHVSDRGKKGRMTEVVDPFINQYLYLSTCNCSFCAVIID